MASFRRMNLLDPWLGLPAMDVILLRNVLIYFDTDTKKEIFGRVKKTLQPDGCLMLGSAESPLNLDDGLVRQPGGPPGCYWLRT
jgi:chemotaxis protein methyltransferase CheR